MHASPHCRRTRKVPSRPAALCFIFLLFQAAVATYSQEEIDPHANKERNPAAQKQFQEMYDGRTATERQGDEATRLNALAAGLSAEEADDLVRARQRSRYLASLARTKSVSDLLKDNQLEAIVADQNLHHFSKSPLAKDKPGTIHALDVWQGFSTIEDFEKALALRAAYERSLRLFRIYGYRQDGRIDLVTSSGRSLMIDDKSYASYLPEPPDSYSRIVVESNVQQFPTSTGRSTSYYPIFNPLDSQPPLPPDLVSTGTIQREEVQRRNGNWEKSATSVVKAPGAYLPLRSDSDAKTEILSVHRAAYYTVLTLTSESNEHHVWIVSTSDSYATGEINSEIQKTRSVVHEGDELSEDWLKALFAGKLDAYVRKVDRSPNVTFTDLKVAGDLGSKNFRSDSTVLFNALPLESGIRLRLELIRMQLSVSDAKAWSDLRDQTSRAADLASLPTRTGTKAEILDQLHSGALDVVLIVAHSVNGMLYLPGRNGDKISISDLDRSARSDTPNRIVVLITCNAGAVNSDTESFAEAILRNHLARTVYATPQMVDATKVPALLAELFRSGRPVRTTLYESGFTQIVELLQNPNDSWMNDPNSLGGLLNAEADRHGFSSNRGPQEGALSR